MNYWRITINKRIITASISPKQRKVGFVSATKPHTAINEAMKVVERNFPEWTYFEIICEKVKIPKIPVEKVDG